MDELQVVLRIAQTTQQFSHALQAKHTSVFGNFVQIYSCFTALAFLYFKEKRCDIVTLEVGCGGLLDATNVIDVPEAAVITRIGLDHTEILGDTVEAIDSLPQTELLKERGMEILYCTDRADEFLADSLRQDDGKEFRSAVDGDLGLEDEPKPQESESDKECLAFIKETLGDRVDEVKASQKLKSHPVCMTSGEGLTFEMEKYFKRVDPNSGMKADRILVIQDKGIAEQGTHKELLERNGIYAALYKSQFEELDMD